jgi:hypothetical protein
MPFTASFRRQRGVVQGGSVVLVVDDVLVDDGMVDDGMVRLVEVVVVVVVEDGTGHAMNPGMRVRPQHSTVPSGRSPHVWKYPLLIWENDPVAGVDSPSSLYPQHATVPSRRSPHV